MSDRDAGGMALEQGKLWKTICQQNQEPVPQEDMERLLEVARGYQAVKNYVYQRYGSIKSLSKIYPGYTVQNEMTKSGLRERLGVPSVYFYLAIFDALGDIKSQWTRTKSAVGKRLEQNRGFSPQEKHYLRFLLKVSNAFAQVLNGETVELKKGVQTQYRALAAEVDTDRLCRYLCRQVRKHHVKLHTNCASGFSLSERAYRYGDHGIYVSVKEKRRRVFIPLTDSHAYTRQLYLKLYPQEGNVEIRVPVAVNIRHHADYTSQVGLALGMYTMLTTDEGHCYGQRLGEYQSAYTEWLRMQLAARQRSQGQGGGRKKYHARKRRYEGQLHSYINQELNRFLKEEKPGAIYIQKFPKPQAGGGNKQVNYAVSLWQRGYIRRRLLYKCRKESITAIEVFGKGISIECSACGAAGTKKDGIFTCAVCGLGIPEKVNTARNAKKRGQGDGAIRYQS